MTRYLTPTDYGIVATFNVLLAVMVVFVGLSMHGAININYFKLKKEELREYIGNVFIILFTNFILIFIIVFFLKTYLSNIIKFPEKWIPIVAIIALCQSIFVVNLRLWQVEQKSFPYGVFQISRTILNVALSLIFVVALVWGWQGRILGVIITSIIYGIISIFVIIKRKYITFSFNKKYIKDALFFGIPLIPHALGGWIMTSIDRIFINSMVGVAATGLYSVGYSVGMIIGLLAHSFNLAWSPFLYKKLKENNYSTKLKIVKLTYLYDVGIIFLALALSFIAPYFLKFFVSKNFYFAYKYVLWIALGYAFQGMYFMVVNYIFYIKKTYILAWVTFFSAGINIILNYFFIKANGAIGAAQATTITFFMQFIMVWMLSAKVYKMPWNICRLKC
jgi:O-antigen/teichoic acid export membrane protein